MKLLAGIIIGIVLVLSVGTVYAANQRFWFSSFEKLGVEFHVADDTQNHVTCYYILGNSFSSPYLQCLKVK